VASELDFRQVWAAGGASLVAAMIEEMRALERGLDPNVPDMPGLCADGKFHGNPVATFFGEKLLSG
jgi:hypothetical protein